MAKSPYLIDRRLADVIAAIQVAGTYKYYKLDFASWSDRITGDVSGADHWRKVFRDHPEFFRFDSAQERASLVLRRQRQKLYNVDDNAEWPKERYEKLDDVAKRRFSRSPLTAGEIESLIDVAISLHARASERARDRRWWMALLIPFLGAILGGVIAKGIELRFDAPGKAEIVAKPALSPPPASSYSAPKP